MSAPAINAYSPEPVIIMTLTELSSLSTDSASLISDIVSKFRAFSFLGLLIINVAIKSDFSNIILL